MEAYSPHHRTPFRRVKDPRDPHRCQGSTNLGQCQFQAEHNSSYCPLHNNSANKDLFNYRLQKFKARVRAGEAAHSPKINELRDEIGIARIMLEERLELITDSQSFMVHGQSCERMLDKIKDLVTTFTNIQQKSGLVLDKTQVQEMANSIVRIVSNYVVDPDVLVNIANEISILFDPNDSGT